jgi:heme-degrading monooxygenase HmoA
MILEIAIISIRPEQQGEFESAFAQARKVIAAMDGFVSLQLQRCIETAGRYALLVQWRTLEDHVVGFRQSPQLQQWRGLLGPFFAAAPAVEHFELVSSGASP